ncbi:serine hydroxymethyltransferase [Streptomyces sp. NPDC091268]|uniref:serine hydroxymethyltransferase n=1 Tax=Streptomyces sp. NPDC091268 TaxID=3365979 RepID=UPI003825C938
MAGATEKTPQATGVPPRVADLVSDGLEALADTAPELLDLAERELQGRAERLNLVAASSPTAPAVLAAQALGFSALTAEGYPRCRYHPGTAVVDEVEQLAVARAELLFGASHANVQPLSGSMANLSVLLGLLEPGDPVLAMDLSHGGHLSHVSRPASLAKHLEPTYYQLGEDGTLDIEHVREKARTSRPKVIICGGSAYPRTIDFAALRSVADEVGALLVGDISHISGLVAAGAHPSPFPHCDVVTTSTYKQLRGPHGGLVLRGPDSRIAANAIDAFVFPGFQGTPDFGMLAAKAVALGGALEPGFGEAMGRVVRYARIFAEAFTSRGLSLVGGGTDTHMVLLDLRGQAVTGRDVSRALEAAGILANKNLVPNDPRTPQRTSGLRIGTNHLAFMGIKDPDVRDLAEGIAQLVLDLEADRRPESSAVWHRLAAQVTALVAATEREKQPVSRRTEGKEGIEGIEGVAA